mmetsp:Transcript_25751/g.43204  ORF Transcript_25751/g.43204 Transcript_25751/m.43204 type:complete len:367 (+) Transcript_25751:1825-2925(+)
MAWLHIAARSPDMISEYALFCVFVEEACAQVQRFLYSLYDDDGNNNEYNNDESGTGGDASTTAGQPLSSIFTDMAELNIALQLFQSTGVLLGLALQSGVPINFPLPSNGCFYEILSNSSSRRDFRVMNVGSGNERQHSASSSSLPSPSAGWKEDVTETIALAMRAGIVSIVPEAAFDLLSKQDLQRLFTSAAGGGGGGPAFGSSSEFDQPRGPPTAGSIYRSATYESPLFADDPHILLFWMATYELSQAQLKAFLLKVMGKILSPATATSSKDVNDAMEFQSQLEELLYGSYSAHRLTRKSDGLKKDAHSSALSALHLHILPPTAMALLSPDLTEIMAFPEIGAISLPRYSNLRTMVEQLQHFITS